jgi:protein translocase SecG subunit
MIYLTWFLTLLLVIDCLVLGLLVLIQLPKKEAGMGQAFGGATTDALFGAGSGTALTKLTKYTAGIFFGLVLVLAILYGNVNRGKTGDLRNALTVEDKLSTVTPLPKSNAPAATAGTTVSATQLNLQITNANSATQSVEKPK